MTWALIGCILLGFIVGWLTGYVYRGEINQEEIDMAVERGWAQCFTQQAFEPREKK